MLEEEQTLTLSKLATELGELAELLKELETKLHTLKEQVEVAQTRKVALQPLVSPAKQVDINQSEIRPSNPESTLSSSNGPPILHVESSATSHHPVDDIPTSKRLSPTDKESDAAVLDKKCILCTNQAGHQEPGDGNALSTELCAEHLERLDRLGLHQFLGHEPERGRIGLYMFLRDVPALERNPNGQLYCLIPDCLDFEEKESGITRQLCATHASGLKRDGLVFIQKCINSAGRRYRTKNLAHPKAEDYKRSANPLPDEPSWKQWG